MKKITIILFCFALVSGLFVRSVFADEIDSLEYEFAGENEFSGTDYYIMGMASFRNDAYKWVSTYTQGSKLFWIDTLTTGFDGLPVGYLCSGFNSCTLSGTFTSISNPSSQNEWSERTVEGNRVFQSDVVIGDDNETGDLEYFKFDTVTGCGGSFYGTSLPCFLITDTKSIYQYLHSGSIAGAQNMEDVNPPRGNEFDPSIPYVDSITIDDTGKKQSENSFVNNIVCTFASNYIDDTNFTDYGLQFYFTIDFLYQKEGIGSNNSQLINSPFYYYCWTGNSGSNSDNNHGGSGGSHDDDLSSKRLTNADYVSYTNTGIIEITLPSDVLNSAIADIKSKYPSLDWYIGKSKLVINRINITGRNCKIDGLDYGESNNFSYNFLTGETSSYNSEQPSTPDNGSTDNTGENNNNRPTGTNNNNPDKTSNNNFTGTITNDYPKYDLFNQLKSIFSADSEMKGYIDNAYNNVGTNLSFTGLLASVMPFLPSEYWGLITLAMGMGVGVTGIRCVYRFLRS